MKVCPPLLLLATMLAASQVSEEASAQRSPPEPRSWTSSVTVGYAEGVGGDFGGKGSVGFGAALYRVLGQTIDLGVEVGHSRLGSTTSVIPGVAGPGSWMTETFAWSVWHAVAMLRLRLGRSSFRPVGILGSGAYLTRSRDEIEARDDNGDRIPFYDFLDTRTEVKPGATVGLAAELPRAFGPVTVGVEARWHGLLAVGAEGSALAEFATIALTLGFR